jgi:hypothetical protein
MQPAIRAFYLNEIRTLAVFVSARSLGIYRKWTLTRS